MSFSESGGVITQSGTDLDLFSLAGVAGVTLSSFGSGSSALNVYNLGSLRLQVNGTLDIDPHHEMIVSNSGVGADGGININNGGVLNINGSRTINGEARYTEQFWLYESTPGSFNDTGLVVGNGATLNWFGGSIFMPRGVSFANGSVVNITNAAADFAQFDDAGEEESGQHQIRQDSSGLNVNGFKLKRGWLTFLRPPAALNGYSPQHCLNALAFSSFLANVDIPLEGFSSSGDNTRDVALWAGSRVVLTNSPSPLILVGPNLVGSATSFGFVVRRQAFNPRIVSDDGPVEGAAIAFVDYDNGNREAYTSEDYLNTPGLQVNSGEGFEYSATTSASGGLASDLMVYTGFVVVNSAQGSSNTGQNTGPSAWDYRGKSNDTTFDFDVYVASYNHQLTSYTANLVGGETVRSGTKLFADVLVTELDRAATDALSGVSNAFEAYDVLKSFLVANYARQTQTLVSREGGTLLASTYNVVLDALAPQLCAFDGTTITLKSAAYDGLIITTGVVSAINGNVKTGGIIDSNGDSFLSFESIDNWVVYASESDRDANTNALGSGSGVEVYRFNYSGGVTYYLRLTTGTDTIFKSVTPSSSGETLVSLGTSALLGNINASIQESSQLAEYGGRVTVDLIVGTDSTAYPYGTSKTPTSSIANAIAIADEIGVKKIEVRGSSTTLPQELNGYELSAGVTDSAGAKLLPTITLSAANGADNCEFEGFEIAGSTDVASPVFGNLYHSCLINGLTGATGVARDCKLAGTIQVEYSIDVQGSYGTVAFNVSGANARLTVPDFSGSMTLAGMTSPSAVSIIGVVSGIVTIDSSCTAGTIVVANADQVVDNSAGASVTILQESGGGGGGLTAQQVWEYDISSISTDGLAGKELLDASGAGSGADVNIVSVNGVAVTSVEDFKADVSAIPTNPLLTTDTRLDNLANADVATSTRLAAADYTVPPSIDGIATSAEIAALQDHGDLNWQTATGFSTFNPTTDTVTVSALQNNVITASTIADNAFTNSAFTTGYYNTINSELDAALADYDAPTKAELDAGLAALQTHGDATWQTATGFSTLDQAGVIAALNTYGASTFDPDTDEVAQVALCVQNSDMRGTDGANTIAPDNATVAAISARTELLVKYHDNDTVFLAADGVTQTTQSLAYSTVTFDDDGTTPLKTVSFRNAADQPTLLPSATGYKKI